MIFSPQCKIQGLLCIIKNNSGYKVNPMQQNTFVHWFHKEENSLSFQQQLPNVAHPVIPHSGPKLHHPENQRHHLTSQKTRGGRKRTEALWWLERGT